MHVLKRLDDAEIAATEAHALAHAELTNGLHAHAKVLTPLDSAEHEAVFAVQDGSLCVASASLKRSHVSWDLFELGHLEIDQTQLTSPQVMRSLLAALENHALGVSTEAQCMLAVGTKTADYFLAHEFLRVASYGEHHENSLMLKTLRGKLVPDNTRSNHTEMSNPDIIVRTLDEKLIREGGRLAQEAWDAETAQSYIDENIRYRSQGGVVCGAFSHAGKLVGSATIKPTAMDALVWGLAWGVVSKEERSQGIGSALSTYRLNYARERTPAGLAIVATENPRHALKNEFVQVARYGGAKEKYILAYDLASKTRS